MSSESLLGVLVANLFGTRRYMSYGDGSVRDNVPRFCFALCFATSKMYNSLKLGYCNAFHAIKVARIEKLQGTRINSNRGQDNYLGLRLQFKSIQP